MGIWSFHGGDIWSEEGFVHNGTIEINVIGEEDRVINLTESAIIVPCLIDFHCHLWAPGAPIGVTDKEYLSSGVLACADAGTFGYEGWEAANHFWEKSPITVRSWLSVLPEGLTIHPNPSPTHPKNISLERIQKVSFSAGDQLLGYKIRLGQVDAETDIAFLQLTRKAADQLNRRIMVHITDTELDIEEVTEYLTKGDIITHPFQGKQGNVLSNTGSVKKGFIESLERGILLDIGHGGNHFTWRVFQKCLSEGIKPHFISTDLTRRTWQNAPVYHLSYIISKMIAAGLSREEVFQSILINAPELLNIDISTSANLVVLEPEFKETKLPDTEGRVIAGNFVYKPKFVINRGVSVI